MWLLLCLLLLGGKSVVSYVGKFALDFKVVDIIGKFVVKVKVWWSTSSASCSSVGPPSLVSGLVVVRWVVVTK